MFWALVPALTYALILRGGAVSGSGL